MCAVQEKNKYKLVASLDDAVVLLAGQQTCDSQVAGSSPGWAPLCSGLGQATYLHLCASVTKQYNFIPAKGDDLFGRESNRGAGEK